jgi:hypothetical protein
MGKLSQDSGNKFVGKLFRTLGFTLIALGVILFASVNFHYFAAINPWTINPHVDAILVDYVLMTAQMVPYSLALNPVFILGIIILGIIFVTWALAPNIAWRVILSILYLGTYIAFVGYFFWAKNGLAWTDISGNFTALYQLVEISTVDGSGYGLFLQTIANGLHSMEFTYIASIAGGLLVLWLSVLLVFVKKDPAMPISRVFFFIGLLLIGVALLATGVQSYVANIDALSFMKSIYVPFRDIASKVEITGAALHIFETIEYAYTGGAAFLVLGSAIGILGFWHK